MEYPLPHPALERLFRVVINVHNRFGHVVEAITTKPTQKNSEISDARLDRLIDIAPQKK